MNDRLTRDRDYKRAIDAATFQVPDPEHSDHVTWLSLRLFDQLAAPLALAPESRPLLAAAAYWHDIGYQRSAEHHHRESHDLIVAQPLKGFSPDERLEIANIARYHRQNDPSVEHTGFRNLPRERRAPITALASLLRLAEALDAGHSQLVRDVTGAVTDDTVLLTVVSDVFPMMELELAQARSALFREAFGRRLDFHRSTPGQGSSGTATPERDTSR